MQLLIGTTRELARAVLGAALPSGPPPTGHCDVQPSPEEACAMPYAAISLAAKQLVIIPGWQ